MLVTDAFGGHGGIALYSRDVLTALCLDPSVEEVVALPRLASLPITDRLPDKLDFDLSSLGGYGSYFLAVARAILRKGPFDLVFCTHINLLPIARAAGTLLRAPVLMTLHGVEAWTPSPRLFNRWAARSADHALAVSEVTLKRFLSWAPYPEGNASSMPNAIHLDKFAPGPKNPAIEARYGLAGRKVVMTFGRLAGSERYKGFDRVIDAMPAILARRPDITYLIAGEGDDRRRLEMKARALGIAEHVVFTGMVAEEEKADTYRLADCYVMPSAGEGFGFVLLEAMACGIPAVGSIADGTREAMREGMLGPVIDPNKNESIIEAVITGVDRPRGVPDGLDYFAFSAFVERLNALTGRLMDRRSISPSA
jgi:glycosyltransferase involved in cell wall biosynthesis